MRLCLMDHECAAEKKRYTKTEKRYEEGEIEREEEGRRQINSDVIAKKDQNRNMIVMLLTLTQREYRKEYKEKM